METGEQMEEIKTAVEVAGQMSQATMLWVMGALVTVITTLGGVVTAQYNKRANPLNGTLVRLNEILVKIDMRTGDSDRVLEGHTEKLIVMGTTMAQLAANEAQQTEVLRSLGPTIRQSITGIGTRMTAHCNERSQAVIDSLETRGQIE